MYIFLHTYEAGRSFSKGISISNFGASEWSPFLLPSAMTKVNLDARVKSLDGMLGEIYNLECQLSVRTEHAADVDLRKLDFTALSREINALNGRLAWTMHSLKQTKRLLAFMDTVAECYRTKALANDFDENETSVGERSLLSSHAYLRSWNQGLLDRTEYLVSRLSLLSQSVSIRG